MNQQEEKYLLAVINKAKEVTGEPILLDGIGSLEQAKQHNEDGRIWSVTLSENYLSIEGYFTSAAEELYDEDKHATIIETIRPAAAGREVISAAFSPEGEL